jgi:flagellar biosynthetic protein FliO
VLSLAVVLGIMAGAAALLRKRSLPGLGGGPRRKAAPIEVLSRQMLGKGASVAVVRAGGHTLVLGVTDTSVRMLAEADPDSFALPGEEPITRGAQRTALPAGDSRLTSTWMAVLDTLRERTVRRS